jgi:transposase
LKQVRVLGVHFEDGGLLVDVAPTTRVPRCSTCGRKARSGYDRRRRRWRHLDLAGMALTLQGALRRVRCRHCGVRVERVPWAEAGSWFTYEFEDQVAYLAQRCDATTVSTLMRMSWRTVGDVVQRVVARRGPSDLLDGLTIIGVDELSYRRHHEYVTVVVDHVQRRVVWARPGKNADTLKAFFDALGPDRCAKLEAVTIDMSGAYIKAVTAASPQAQIIFDRFHIERLAHDALDEVRREQVRQADTREGAAALKKTRWPLQKNPWNLSKSETEKLASIQRVNKPLYRAYLLKESLLDVLDRHQVHVAGAKLDEWLRWARRSRLRPFIKLARTIVKHRDGILAYVRTRLSNGRTEALNGKIRTITRRAFGFHSALNLIALIMLCCSGLHLSPVFHYA